MIVEKIIKKRQKSKSFTFQDLELIINGYVKNDISDEDMTKFIRFIFENGMNDEEIFSMSKIMENSGKILNLTQFENTVDKHSSGGVSDTTTIIIVPILASLGCTMLKMSGGGLGFTGGTADKIKYFNNIKNELSFAESKEIITKCHGIFLTQSKKMVPADKKIYALRDKTNLIESIPLIASSIASKKMACGAKNIILDIKCGDGAFMQSFIDAKKLAKTIVEILKKDDKNACAVISNMNQPLGNFIGDYLEVREALEILQNKRKNNLYKLSVFISAKLLSMAKHIPLKKSERLVKKCIKSGQALKKLQEIVEMQHGEFVLPSKKINANFLCFKSTIKGFISHIHTKQLGLIEKQLKNEVDGFLGFEIKVQIGDKVKQNTELLKIYSTKELPNTILKEFDKIFVMSNKKRKEKLIREIIE